MNGTFRTAVLWLSLVDLHTGGGEVRPEYGVWLNGRPVGTLTVYAGVMPDGSDGTGFCFNGLDGRVFEGPAVKARPASFTDAELNERAYAICHTLGLTAVPDPKWNGPAKGAPQ